MTTSINADQGGVGVNVKQFGAKGDGVTDDTAAILAAFSLGGTVYLPAGTYLLGTLATYSLFYLSNVTNLRIVGAGMGKTILKVKDNLGPYGWVFNIVFASGTQTKVFSISDLTIDSNIDNNPITSLAEITTANQLRKEIEVSSATDNTDVVVIDRVEILNTSSINCFVLGSGTDLAMGRIAYNRVKVTADPNNISHDHSTIYTNVGNVLILGNEFLGDDPVLPYVANTGIEVHCRRTRVIGNAVLNYNTGCIVAGIADHDTTEVVVSGNTFDVSTYGISIWSNQYASHTTGFGINGLLITGNTVSIHQNKTAANNLAAGVLFEPNADLPYKNIVISGNTFRAVLELTSKTWNYSGGIWYFGDFLGAAAMPIHNLTISENILENFPCPGIVLAGKFTGLSVQGNTIRNCGSNLDPTFYLYYGMIFTFFQADGITITNNTILDDLATTRMTTGIYLGGDAGLVSKGIHVSKNQIRYTGDGVAFIRDITIADLTVLPLVDHDSAYNVLPYGRHGAGSRYTDLTIPKTYEMWDSLGNWRGVTYGTAAPTVGFWARSSVCWRTDATSGQPAGWICTAEGTPGTWKAMANLA
jgi:hypothetical protein